MAQAEHAIGIPVEREDKGGLSLPGMGTVLFLASEVMFFATLFGTYFTLRAAAPNGWPPPGTPDLELEVPAILTGILLTSSVTLHAAQWGLRYGNRRLFLGALATTLALGVLFLGGEAFDAFTLDMAFDKTAYASIFYTILAFHGLHVTAGVIFLAYLLVGALLGRVGIESEEIVDSAAYYWHFVDIVWLFVFSVLYLAK